MEYLVFDLFFSLLGWVYMMIRFPKSAQRKSVLKDRYADSYQIVGREKMLKGIALLFVLLILGLIIASLISEFK